MAILFGVDIPLVELIFMFMIISFIILIESTIIAIMLLYQLKNSRKMSKRLNRITSILSDLEEKHLNEEE